MSSARAKFRLHVTVVGAKDLPPIDGGSADPFVKLKVGAEKFKTGVIVSRGSCGGIRPHNG